ncbi:MAG: hypothetical protein GX673_09790 [Gammaproteobacteria bacterium]|nr:hypothetical protein [Gammaproteobacteria bacterium]
MYEQKNQPLLTLKQFSWRLVNHGLIAFIVISVSVLIGMLGFMFFEAMFWHDAFLYAALLLSGHGSLSVPSSVAGKLFVGFYGMYAGLVFVTVLGIVFSPVAHRVMHKLNLSTNANTDTDT